MLILFLSGAVLACLIFFGYVFLRCAPEQRVLKALKKSGRWCTPVEICGLVRNRVLVEQLPAICAELTRKGLLSQRKVKRSYLVGRTYWIEEWQFKKPC